MISIQVISDDISCLVTTCKELQHPNVSFESNYISNYGGVQSPQTLTVSETGGIVSGTGK